MPMHRYPGMPAHSAFGFSGKINRMGNQPKYRRAIILLGLLLLCATGSGQGPFPELVGAQRYFSLVRRGTAQSRGQLPVMTASATVAAQRLVEGGKIWVTGPQMDFQIEAIVRAGGLVALRQLKDAMPADNDVVLMGASGPLDETAIAEIRKWRQAGAYVVAFCAPMDHMQEADHPDCVIDHGGLDFPRPMSAPIPEIYPLDTVINVINMWTWTGELAAACTRLGKMPVFYQSYGLPGGRERGAKYAGQTFHDDMQITPIAPGVLGGAYLDRLTTILRRMSGQLRQSGAGMDQLRRVAQLMQPDGPPALGLVIGHMFPGHFQDPRAPQPMRFLSVREDATLEAGDRGRFVFYLGYQKAPVNLIEQAMAEGFRLIYVSVTPHDPAEPASSITYIDPGWPITDACVNIQGYDIPVLPVSGVVNAVIYWSILAEATSSLEMGGPGELHLP